MTESYPILTLLIIALTALTSIRAFQSPELTEKMIFRPYFVKQGREYYRFLSSGFIHADWVHLAVNMFVLFSFGRNVEYIFHEIFGAISTLIYTALYVIALVISSIPAYFKHKDHSYYGALGASGATSAVVFASILLFPEGGIGFIFLPGIDIPAPLFGILYLVYSWYMAKKGGDNIGHDAHFYGAVFGFIFPLFFAPGLFLSFLDRLQYIF